MILVKKFGLGILFVFLIGCSKEKHQTKIKSSGGYEYEYVTNDPTETRIYTLDNGLKVYLSRFEKEPRIQIFTAVKAGGKNDPENNTGLAHYLEHMMFKGTETIPPGKFSEIVAEQGGEENADDVPAVQD